ncbi:oxygen-independent coproporphyrinogen III oxidase, partial [Vibrio sp. 1579]|nr:oxygen-independent coproporphyrinogen III oxidase [Vibrio sp. 1579]
EDLPKAGEKLAILPDPIATLTGAGYQFIGMDHFAMPDDELAVAQREGVLHRNFQGYTTQGECDLVGFGVSAISMIGDAYAQNQKELKKYYAQVNDLRHALWKGVSLDSDDLLRREVIKQLICNFKLDKKAIESEFRVKFDQYFKEDLQLLQTFINDELVEVDDNEIRVTLRGRL